MRLSKLKRFLSLAMALVFCLGITIFPDSPLNEDAYAYNEPDVRVGIYVGKNVRFSSLNQSASGSFEIGYSSSGFTKLFDLGKSQIVIIPQVNAYYDSASKSCSPSSNGNIGAYSTVISRHNSYSEAYNVAKTIKDGFVAVVNGGFEARGFSGTSADAVKKASSGRAVASPASGLTVIDPATGKIIFTYEDSSKRLAIRATGGSTVSLPFKSNTYSYYGYFEYANEGSYLKMINVVPLETYVVCVMGMEIGMGYYSAETSKAFSIMVRTFVLRHKHGNDYFVCSTDCCQVYLGTYRWSDINVKYVNATKGQYCAYNGEPILAVYHNSNGGASCSSLAAWGGSDLPYLKTVYSNEKGETEIWKYEYTKDEFFKYISSRSKFSSISDSDIKFEILATDPYGSNYITQLSVTDGKGNNVVINTAESVRVACGFESANFDAEYSAQMEVLTKEGKVEKSDVKGILTADGYKPFQSFDDSHKTTAGTEISPEKIIINGKGTGHGVGFSVYGSEELAKDGYNYQYILTHYFYGTKILSL